MEQERFEEFAGLITGVYRDIQKLKLKHTEELTLKNVHIFWVYLLAAHPEGLSASDLAKAGKTNRSLVSREVDVLVGRGLITTREQTGRRRYGWKFVLTEQGHQLAGKIGDIALDVQRRVSMDVPEEELCIFYKTLHTLLANFDALAEERQKPTGE